MLCLVVEFNVFKIIHGMNNPLSIANDASTQSCSM